MNSARIRFACIAAWCLLGSSCDLGLCGEEELSRAVAPSGRLVAVAYVRNCGATTRFVSHVNVRETAQEFTKTSAGIIVAGEVLTLDGEPSTIELAWPDAKTLRVRYSGGARLTHSEASWNDVHVVLE
jgi:hypothetical protein